MQHPWMTGVICLEVFLHCPSLSPFLLPHLITALWALVLRLFADPTPVQDGGLSTWGQLSIYRMSTMPGTAAKLSSRLLSEWVDMSSFMEQLLPCLPRLKSRRGENISGRCLLLAILLFPKLPGFGENWL